MYKRIITLLILLPSFVLGQSITEIDQKTHALFSQGKWEELIEEGKHARDAGVDFYYLRSRMAISYYKLKDYRKAIPLFEGVFADYSADPVIHEYLYWAYVLAGRQKDALLFVGKLSDEEKEKLGVKPRVVSKISLEGGIGSNPGYEDRLQSPLSNAEDISADEMGYEDQVYLNVGMEHELTHWLSLKHSLTKLDVNRYLHFDYIGYEPNFSKHTLKQGQYYLGANIALKKGWHLQPSYHFIWGDVTPTSYSSDQGFYKKKTSYSEGVGFIGLKKNQGNWLLTLSGLFGELNKTDISQVNAGFIYYPKGNTDLYLTSDLSIQNRDNSLESESSFVYTGKLGGRIWKLWLEGNVTFGELVNFVDNDNQTIWNSAFPIKKKLGGSVYLPIANYKLALSLRYTYLDMEGTTTVYSNNIITTEIFPFKNHLITGGITWNL